MQTGCLICGRSDADMGQAEEIDGFKVICDSCGTYWTTREFAADLPGEVECGRSLRQKLARHMYETWDEQSRLLRGVRVPSWPGRSITFEFAGSLYQSDEGTPFERFQQTLRNLLRRSRTFGQRFSSETDRWLMPTMSGEEAYAILDQLSGEDYISMEHYYGSRIFSLTGKGHACAQQLVAHGDSLSIAKRAAGPDAPRVFLSHSHKDKGFVERLASNLEQAGISVWYAGWDLEIGHDLTVMIQKGIQDSDFLAVILSPAAVQSAWVETEWTTAFHRGLEERRVVVLPILFQDCAKPPFLNGKVHADFRSEDQYQQSLADLIRCIRGESKRPSAG